jgi:hypothetical protein
MQSFFFILFEAVIIIKKEHFLSILTMSLTIILPGTTNNKKEFPRIFLDSLRHDVYLHLFKNKP